MNWGDLYALVATSCGYTWDEIDAMRLPALRELLDYWARHPPAHLVLASAFGVKQRSKPERAGFAELARLAPSGVLGRQSD